MPRGRKPVDLTGQTFSQLYVLIQGPSCNNHARWYCKCNCGNRELQLVYSQHLRNGEKISCGCTPQSYALKKKELPASLVGSVKEAVASSIKANKIRRIVKTLSHKKSETISPNRIIEGRKSIAKAAQDISDSVPYNKRSYEDSILADVVRIEQKNKERWPLYLDN